MYRHRRAFFAFIVALLVLGCEAYQRARQVKTIANMQTVAAIIEALQNRDPVLNAQQMRSAILRVNGGRDAWGTSIAYRLRVANGRSSYILVSAGSDRTFDVPDIGAYFLMPVHYSKRDSARDLVVRDGDEITLAGK